MKKSRTKSAIKLEKNIYKNVVCVTHLSGSSENKKRSYHKVRPFLNAYGGWFRVNKSTIFYTLAKMGLFHFAKSVLFG
jgi:hypothetical protein